MRLLDLHYMDIVRSPYAHARIVSIDTSKAGAMPGVLIVEAMAQLGGLLLSSTLEHTGRVALLLSLDKVKLRKAVTPGDQLVLEAETIRANARTASLRCRASVAGKPAAEAEIRFMMVDSDQT